jgi:cleavage stimulation factor subunit 2
MRDVPGAGPPGRPTGPTGGAPMPAGRAPGAPSTGNPVQEVTKVLQEMSTQQIYEIMVQMKGLIQQNPDQARQILSSNPQVAYALLQAQILLGYVTPAVAQQLLVSTTPGPAAMMAGPMQPIGMPPQSVGQPPMMPPGPMQGGPMSYGAPPGVPPGGFVPQPVTPYGIPPVAVAPPPVAAPGPGSTSHPHSDPPSKYSPDRIF